MEIIYFILPLALVFAAGAVWAFFWAAKRGQFDDLDTPPFRVLMDDETTRHPNEKAATPPTQAAPEATPNAADPPTAPADDDATPSPAETPRGSAS